MRHRKDAWRAFGLATFFAAAAAACAAPPADRIAFCESCHGPAGNSTTPGMPSLAGQPATFLENQLVFFREGLRNAPVMQPIAKGMKDEEITALARHFAAQKPAIAAAAAADPALMEKGERLAERLHCGQCHLPGFEGRAQMPRLAGQREDYLFDAMLGYRDAKRTGADTTMTEVLQGLADEDIRALAHFTSRGRRR